jgi:hypothetical protein
MDESITYALPESFSILFFIIISGPFDHVSAGNFIEVLVTGHMDVRRVCIQYPALDIKYYKTGSGCLDQSAVLSLIFPQRFFSFFPGGYIEQNTVVEYFCVAQDRPGSTLESYSFSRWLGKPPLKIPWRHCCDSLFDRAHECIAVAGIDLCSKPFKELFSLVADTKYFRRATADIIHPFVPSGLP